MAVFALTRFATAFVLPVQGLQKLVEPGISFG